MKIREFIQDRNVSYQTVRKYIKNHPEIFDGHVGRSNNIVLDDVAIEALDQKYPRPQMIQIVEDTEVRKQLVEAQQIIIKLQQQLLDVNSRILISEKNNLLLIAAENEIKDLKEENSRLFKELETERSKTWIDKLLKK